MRTVEERAQDFVSSGEYSPSLRECYIAGASEEHLLLTHWNNIEADRDGFTTNKCAYLSKRCYLGIYVCY